MLSRYVSPVVDDRVLSRYVSPVVDDRVLSRYVIPVVEIMCCLVMSAQL